MRDSAAGALGVVREKKEDVEMLAKVEAARARERAREEYHEGILKGVSGVGIYSASGLDLGKESFTGGSAVGVRARRAAEAHEGRRLV